MTTDSVYPNGIDSFNLSLDPDEVALGESGPFLSHIQAHEKIGKSIVATQQNVDTKTHDHSNNKLSQTNTHQGADTDSSQSAAHHTIGKTANQYSLAGHTHNPTSLGIQGNDYVLRSNSEILNPKHPVGNSKRLLKEVSSGTLTLQTSENPNFFRFAYQEDPATPNWNYLYLTDPNSVFSDGWYDLSFDVKGSSGNLTLVSNDWNKLESIPLTSSWVTHTRKIYINRNLTREIQAAVLACTSSVASFDVRNISFKKSSGRIYSTFGVAGTGYSSGVVYYETVGIQEKESSENASNYFRVIPTNSGNGTRLRILRSGLYSIKGRFNITYQTPMVLGQREFYMCNIFSEWGDLQHEYKYAAAGGAGYSFNLQLPLLKIMSPQSISFGNYNSQVMYSYAGGASDPTSEFTIELIREI